MQALKHKTTIFKTRVHNIYNANDPNVPVYKKEYT